MHLMIMQRDPKAARQQRQATQWSLGLSGSMRDAGNFLAAGAFALAGALFPVAAGAIDINGGTSWNGWTQVGNSLQSGIWADDSTTRSFDIYQSVFTWNNNPITGNQDQVSASAAPGFAPGAYSNGAFAVGDRILAIGLSMQGGADVVGYEVVKFGLGANRYQAASSVGATDGKASMTTWGMSGDFAAWLYPSLGPAQLTVLSSNGTSQGGTGSYSNLPGGVGSGTSYDFAYREFRQGTTNGSVQMFFDLTAMQALYGVGGSLATTALTGVGTSPCSGGGAWPCGSWNPSAMPIGAFPDTISLALTSTGGASQTTVAFDVTLNEPIPEPTTAALLGAGLLGLGLFRRRRAV